jgi:hypothetical protein
MQALVKNTVLPQLVLLANPFDRRFAAASPRYHDPKVYEEHRQAGRLRDALRGAYHDYLYTGHPKSRLACISIVWEMGLVPQTPWKDLRATAFLLFAALNLPRLYQQKAHARLLPSGDVPLLNLASAEGRHYLRAYGKMSYRLLNNCPNLPWPARGSPRSSFVEWAQRGPGDGGNDDSDGLPAAAAAAPEEPAPHLGRLDLLCELDKAFAGRRHYDPDVLLTLQLLGLEHARAGGSQQALRCLRQALWGAYRAYLAVDANAELLVDATRALAHGHVLILHSGETVRGESSTSLARTLLAASGWLAHMSAPEHHHYLLFQAYAETFLKGDAVFGLYLQYLQQLPLDLSWKWLEQEVWAHVQSRDLFFL